MKFLLGVIAGFGLAMAVAHHNGLNAKPWIMPEHIYD